MFKRLTFMLMLVLFLPLAAAQEASAETTLDAEVTVAFNLDGTWVEVDASSESEVDVSKATQVKVTAGDEEYIFDIHGTSDTFAGTTLAVETDDGDAPSIASIVARLRAAQEQGLQVTTMNRNGDESDVVTYVAISGPAGPASAEAEGEAEVETAIEVAPEETEGDAEGNGEAGATVEVDEEDGNKTVSTPSGVTVTIPGEDNENGDEGTNDVDGTVDGEAGASVTVNDGEDTEEENKVEVETPSGVTVTVPAEPGANGDDEAEGGENGDEVESEEQNGDDDEEDEGEDAEPNASVDVNVDAEVDVGPGGNEKDD